MPNFRLKNLLCKVDINPQDNHQDDRGWNQNDKRSISFLQAVIQIKDYKTKHTENIYETCAVC